MALAFDAASSVAAANTSSTSWSHTCTGANRILIVGVYTGGAGSYPVTGVTYAGAAMTLITSFAPTNVGWIGLYYLIAPATGANNVVVSLSSNFVAGLASSYTGAKQSGQMDASTTSSASSGSSLTTTLTTFADNCWTLIFDTNNQNASMTAGTGTTSRVATNSFFGAMIADSNGVIHPAGSSNLIATSNSGFWGSIMVSIAPLTSTPFSRTMSDSIMNSISRLVTSGRIAAYSRTESDSIMNSVSRLATVGKGLIRTMSDSIMNSSSRFATVANIRGFVRTISASIMNSASRFATVSRLGAFSRLMADSVMNAVSRLATVNRIRAINAHLSDSIMNARGRLTVAKSYVNGLLIQFISKYVPQGTTFAEKYQKQNTVYEDKYQ